jgi:hypothetical protein
MLDNMLSNDIAVDLILKTLYPKILKSSESDIDCST